MNLRETKVNDPGNAESALNRRSFLSATLGLAAVNVVAGAFVPKAEAETSLKPCSDPGRVSPTIIASDENAIAQTAFGKVRGYTRLGINTFKGIPYGDTTAGANRFMPPQPVKAWTGLRSSMQYGDVSPQAAREGWSHDEEAWMFSWNDGIQGEDCLRLNIWTPALKDGKKRPVMVWLHGGGFAAGSGQELLSYDGERLARRGDVVVVSLNHRLNAMGYLNLASYGDRFAHSANVGMLDIVAALEWVRDNIANFGGDPQCVTIFGQSGGGGKVSTLMAMPAAKGLFHRAIVESGSMLRAGTPDTSSKLAAELLAELNLKPDQIDQLQSLPFATIVETGNRIVARNRPAGPPNFHKMAEAMGWAPIVDAVVLPHHPFDPGAPQMSANVPMIIGTTLNEFVTALNHPEYELMTKAELVAKVHAVHPSNAEAIIAAYSVSYPKAKPFDLWSMISISSVRENAVTQAQRKAALGAAPAYLYQFAWQTPVLDGRPRAFHCSEIAFVFDNTDRCENMTGGGEVPRELAAKMADAWISFARTGKPDHPGLPGWTTVSEHTAPTMVFDTPCHLVGDLDSAELRLINA
jgi:para-nitrobenzyl esterase